MEEAMKISDKRIEENAKKFAKKVVEKQRNNILVKEEQYV
jgi:hypothetical protein